MTSPAPSPSRSPHSRNSSGTSISQRLGYYLAGVAIGVVLLGFFMRHKQRAVEAERAGIRDTASDEGASVEEPVSAPPADGP